MSRPLFSIIAVFLFISVLSVHATAGERAQPLRIAVLDLDSPSSTPWLGAAVSEAIRVKLAGMESVALLERERIQEILLAAKGKAVHAELLGVAYILTGSIQLSGDWANAASPVRVNAQILAVESAKVSGESAFILDSTVGRLFSLEAELAQHFVTAFGGEATSGEINYCESRNLKAMQLFGEGLNKLTEAEVILAPMLTDPLSELVTRADGANTQENRSPVSAQEKIISPERRH